MRDLFVQDYYDSCDVIHLLDAVGISGSIRCGCLDLDTCIRQTKGTSEYTEYLAKKECDKDIRYNCPKGTFFEIPDDRIEEAKNIRELVEKRHLINTLKRQSRKLLAKLDWRTYG